MKTIETEFLEKKINETIDPLMQIFDYCDFCTVNPEYEHSRIRITIEHKGQKWLYEDESKKLYDLFTHEHLTPIMLTKQLALEFVRYLLKPKS